MNAEAETTSPGQQETPVPNLTLVPGDASSSISASSEMLATALPQKKKSKPKGKIAELPQNQRDLVNHLFDEGATYKVVEEEMAKLGVSLNGENLSNWFNGPYQDYVRDREWREDILAHIESGSSLGELTSNGQKFQETIIQVALVDIFRALKDPTTRTDPLNHIRTLNALARLNREALSLRKYSDLRADQAAAHIKIVEGSRSADDYRNSFLVGFETVTGIKPADGPIGPDLNDYPARPAESASSSSSSSSTPQSAEGGRRGGEIPSPRGPQNAERSSLVGQQTGGGLGKPLGQGEGELAAPVAPESTEGRPVAPKSNEAGSSSSSSSASSSNPQSKIQNQNSKIDAPAPQLSTSQAELCYSCSVPLPPLKPDGTRPSRTCPGCHTRLYQPGTTFDHCPVCDAFQPILPTDERHSSNCERCHQMLPPPGQHYLTQYPNCDIQLRNFDLHGTRIIERCRNCLTPLPLLEPIPDPNQNSKIENQKSDEPPPLATAA